MLIRQRRPPPTPFFACFEKVKTVYYVLGHFIHLFCYERKSTGKCTKVGSKSLITVVPLLGRIPVAGIPCTMAVLQYTGMHEEKPKY
jgi:hypothetical protein